MSCIVVKTMSNERSWRGGGGGGRVGERGEHMKVTITTFCKEGK